MLIKSEKRKQGIVSDISHLLLVIEGVPQWTSSSCYILGDHASAEMLISGFAS